MTKTLRLIYLILFLLLILVVHSAHTARGQSAVPDFPPAAPRILLPQGFVPDANFTPDNPGALQWGAPSRFGLGQINTQVEDKSGGKTDTTNYDGYYAGLRWVTEVFALAGEVVNLQDNDNNYDTNVINGAVSIPFGSVLGLGLGMDTSTIDTGSAKDSLRAPKLGLSVNLNESFFIGFALGREYLHHDPDSGSAYDSDRAIQNYGLAFRKGGQGTTFHLEYFVVRRDPFKHAGVEFDEHDEDHIVVELNWSSILLSAHWVDFTVDKVDGKTQIYAAGWAPQKGLAVLGQYEVTAVDDSGAKLDANTTSISIAYQF